MPKNAVFVAELTI